MNATSLSDGCQVWLKDVRINKCDHPRSFDAIKRSTTFDCVTSKNNADGKQVWLSWHQRGDAWSHWGPQYQIHRFSMLLIVNVRFMAVHLIFMIPCIHRAFFIGCKWHYTTTFKVMCVLLLTLYLAGFGVLLVTMIQNSSAKLMKFIIPCE